MKAITENRFKKIFPYCSLEDNKYRITIRISNLHHVVFDKLRNLAIFYKMGDLSTKRTMGMLEEFRTDDLNELIKYLEK